MATPQSWMVTAPTDPDIRYWDATAQMAIRGLWDRFHGKGLTGIGSYVGHDPSGPFAADNFFPMGGWEIRPQDGVRCPAGIQPGWDYFFFVAENLLSLGGTYVVYCQHIFNSAIDSPNRLAGHSRAKLRCLKVRTDDPRGNYQVANHGDHNHISFKTAYTASTSTAVKKGTTNWIGTAWVQCRLNMLGSRLTVDGGFGAATDAELRKYQGAHKLDVDGVAGPLTQESLARDVETLTGNPPQPPQPPAPSILNRFAAMPTLAKGSANSAAVLILQRALQAAYNPAIAVDGDFGPNTHLIVCSFQAAPLGGALPANGTVETKTWAKLDTILDWQNK